MREGGNGSTKRRPGAPSREHANPKFIDTGGTPHSSKTGTRGTIGSSRSTRTSSSERIRGFWAPCETQKWRESLRIAIDVDRNARKAAAAPWCSSISWRCGRGRCSGGTCPAVGRERCNTPGVEGPLTRNGSLLEWSGRS